MAQKEDNWLWITRLCVFSHCHVVMKESWFQMQKYHLDLLMRQKKMPSTHNVNTKDRKQCKTTRFSWSMSYFFFSLFGTEQVGRPHGHSLFLGFGRGRMRDIERSLRGPIPSHLGTAALKAVSAVCLQRPSSEAHSFFVRFDLTNG
jgi:hypothetical protein